jgi:hypothetical protein
MRRPVAQYLVDIAESVEYKITSESSSGTVYSTVIPMTLLPKKEDS